MASAGSTSGEGGLSSGTFTTTTLNMENCSLAAATSLCELANSVKERQGMWIFGETESKRRVIIIEKKNGSYGFTLQSYGVRYKHGNRETDFITYVNAVEKDGAAYAAGLREGDVILSINGQNMARVEHKSLVSYIRKCPMHLKMVVVSDERARKVELHMRYVHLQKKLQDKIRELEDLQRKEREILSGELESHRRSNSPSPLAGPCIAAAAKVCCFCPPSKAEKLEAKEKSKSIGSTSGAGERMLHGKENILYYDCYRKSQSSRELHKEQNSSIGKLTSTTQKASSGGDIITISNSSNNSLVTSSNSMTKVNSAMTTQPQSQQHRPGCYQYHGSSGNNTSTCGTPPAYGSQQPQNSQNPNVTGSDISSNTGGYTSDSAQKYNSSSSSKPKSWDNLMGTKSFGGYGFGFGYGYFPQRHAGPEGTSGYHVIHPHHHNHHTHCSNHTHSNYYYKQKAQQNAAASGMPLGVPPPPGSSVPPLPTGNPSYGGGNAACSGAHHRYHAYPTRNSAGATVRSPFSVTAGSLSHGDPNNSGANFRTLPLPKSSTSRTSDSSSGVSPKMEKTLSDSSLNSEHHKDFPKAMSYFRTSENEDTHYSSEDEYDQYATESSYEGKRIFV